MLIFASVHRMEEVRNHGEEYGLGRWLVKDQPAKGAGYESSEVFFSSWLSPLLFLFISIFSVTFVETIRRLAKYYLF